MRLYSLTILSLSLSSLLAGAMTSDEIVKEVMSKNSGKYQISGTFAKYEFSKDEKSNWTFTLLNGDTYQLLGDTSKKNIKAMGPFGWKKVDVEPNEPLFYAVNYSKNSFDWLFFTIDKYGNCKKIYKLAGQDSKTLGFDYDFDKDGKIETVDMLDCKVNGNEVIFTTFTKENFEKILNPNETYELKKGDKLISLTDNTRFKIVTDVATLTNSVSVLNGLAKVTKQLDSIANVKDVLLLNNSGEYKIAGYFSYYKFSEDEKSNWIFTLPNGDSYQLLGDLSEQNIKKSGIFGWKKVDIKPNKPIYYAVNFENSKFGWIFFTLEDGKCKDIYKLAGQSRTKEFLYDIDGDGKIDKLKGISCSIDGDIVKFK